MVVCNFTPTVHHGYRLGVPHPGVYSERLNTDSVLLRGGSKRRKRLTFGVTSAQPLPWQGQPHSVLIDVPPLATLMLQWRA